MPPAHLTLGYPYLSIVVFFTSLLFPDLAGANKEANPPPASPPLTETHQEGEGGRGKGADFWNVLLTKKNS